MNGIQLELQNLERNAFEYSLSSLGILGLKVFLPELEFRFHLLILASWSVHKMKLIVTSLDRNFISDSGRTQ